MESIIIKNNQVREEWLDQLSDVITDPIRLLKYLKLDDNSILKEGAAARKLFPFRVPKAFVERMTPGDPNDPLLRQVLTTIDEFCSTPGYSKDPLNEQHSKIPGLLHKYRNRALLFIKTSCAINCRYCFRRYFPYQYHQRNKNNWVQALDYISQHTEINEIIFSGGDPLLAKDEELERIIACLENIAHIKTLRIHSRLLVAIPTRITNRLCYILSNRRLKVILVTHINHSKEINTKLFDGTRKLRNAGVILFNQSVLLRGINDNATKLANLSESLFSVGIIPYYLHMLDRVHGTAHFMVDDQKAKLIIHQLMEKVSGYLVPRLVREIKGEKSKTLLDLGLKQF